MTPLRLPSLLWCCSTVRDFDHPHLAHRTMSGEEVSETPAPPLQGAGMSTISGILLDLGPDTLESVESFSRFLSRFGDIAELQVAQVWRSLGFLLVVSLQKSFRSSLDGHAFAH